MPQYFLSLYNAIHHILDNIMIFYRWHYFMLVSHPFEPHALHDEEVQSLQGIGRSFSMPHSLVKPRSDRFRLRCRCNENGIGEADREQNHHDGQVAAAPHCFWH
jgi:hypothetical protein